MLGICVCTLPRCLLDNQALVAKVESAAKAKGELALATVGWEAKAESAEQAKGELALAPVGGTTALCSSLRNVPGFLRTILLDN